MKQNLIKKIAPKGVLRAGINMSNFLLVTGKDNYGFPEGISPDIAKKVANVLEVDCKLIPFSRPGELADAVNDDVWDIGNIAFETERANTINFSKPYVLIDANFLVNEHSNIKKNEDVDKPGIKIVVAERSAYDLWLTENFVHSKIIRVSSIQSSHDFFNQKRADVLAGLKPKLLDELAINTNYSIIEKPFTSIKQSIGVKKGNEDVVIFLNNIIDECLRNGFMNQSLKKHNVNEKLSLPKFI